MSVSLPPEEKDTKKIVFGVNQALEKVQQFGGSSSFTYAKLPTNPKAGAIYTISDGVSGASFGSSISGSSSTQVLVWHNGGKWTVIGK